MFTIPFFISSVLLFFVGAAVGSFVNVVIDRTFNEEQWVHGRSHCDHCGTLLPWYDLFPLVSFFILRGRSRCCQKQLSIGHPVVEFLTGSLFVWWYWGLTVFFHLTRAPFQLVQPLFWLVVGIILVVIFFSDLWYMLIPDTAVGLLLVLTLLYRVSLTISEIMQVSDFIYTVIASMIAAGFFFLLWFGTKGKGMGFGDVKLSFPLVFLLGWKNSFVGFFLSFVIGAVIGVLLILAKKKKVKQHIPFGPFMIIGALISLIWGDVMLQWYISLF